MELLTAGIENKFTDSLGLNLLSSFPGSKEMLNFFLKNKFNPKFCNAIIKGDQVISSVQALPQEIILEGKSFSAKYIYAAATLPNFRGKGSMKKLLDFTAEIEKKRNTDFLFLVPCCKAIEKYYEKLGYENFFKIRKINFSNENFKKLISENPCTDGYSGDFEPSVEKMCDMVYNDINHVKYCQKDIDYAKKLYTEFFRGKIITSDKNFAICFYCKDNILKIIYFCAENFWDSKLLLHSIYKEFPSCSEYNIDVCAENKFFKLYCRSEFYGMIKPLSPLAEKAVPDIKKNKKFPYLALPLD